MEASVAGGEGAGGEAAAAGGQEAGGAPGFDFGQLGERLDGIERGLSGLGDLVQQSRELEPEAPYPGQEALDAQLNPEDLLNEGGQIDPQALMGQFEQMMQQRLEQATGPLTQQLQNMQIAQESSALVEEIPALKDPEVVASTVARAQEEAQRAGVPDAWRSPAFVRLVYLAAEAEKGAADEVSAGGGQGPGLENAGGAVPRGEQEPGIAEQVKQAHRNRGFWG